MNGLNPARGAFTALRSRRYSQVAKVAPSVQAIGGAKIQKVQYPYFVPRNSLGSLPVYTDIRNGGTRYTVLIKNIQGDLSALRSDISASLLKSDSPELARLRTEIARNNTIVLTGGRWKHQVMEWLKLRGF